MPIPGYLFTGAVRGDAFGSSVANAGDVNGDGTPDIIVGAHQANTGPFFLPGFARVFSGATGAVMTTLTGSAWPDAFGLSVDGAGDVNGDGFADVVVGAPNAGPNSEGQAVVYSGAFIASGAQVALYTIDATEFTDGFATRVSGIGDVNLDGTPDILVNGPWDAVTICDGTDGTELYRIGDIPSIHTFGVAIDSIGDVNMDGCADYIIGYDGESPEGAARVFNGSGVAYTSGPSAPNMSNQNGAEIGWAGSASVSANDLTLTVTGANPTQVGIFLYGAQETFLPLFNGFLLINSPQVRINTITTADAAGNVSLTLDLPTLPAGAQILAGSLWHFQYWYRDNLSGANFSNRLTILFAP
jgi:large repetitive protein